MQLTVIKQTFQRIFLLAALAASVVACKKDKDKPSPDPLPGNAKLQQYTNGEDFIRFVYNADGTVKKVILRTDLNTNGDEVEYNVTYNAQKKIASIESRWQKIEPEYDNTGLVRARIFEDNKQIGYTNYHFENGNLVDAVIYAGEAGVYVMSMGFNMTYTAQGNVSETAVFLANGEPDHLERTGSVKFEYDQKTNPLYAHKDLLALFWQVPSKNNVTVENHLDAQMQPEDKYVYTYTYKANGLPEKATVKQGLPGEEPATSQLGFIYQ